jgi:hypothetical protein
MRVAISINEGNTSVPGEPKGKIKEQNYCPE